MSLKKFESLKKKLTNSIKIMPHLRLSKNMFLGQKTWKNKIKIATHMDL
jgi:ribosomal protein S18